MKAGADTVLHAVEPVQESEGFSLISNARLWELYAAMMQCRMTAEAARSFEACIGWEAAAAAVTVDLHAEDWLSTTAPSALAALVKGVPAAALLGKTGELPGCGVLPRAAGDAARLNVACGVALAEKVRKSGRVVVAFLSDEDEARAWTREALEFCSAQQLPMILVDLHGSSARQSMAQGADKKALANFACGVPVIAADGSDVVAMYRVASEALARARQDRGPTVIECLGPAHEAMRNWFGKDHDPVAAMEEYLRRKGLFREERKRELIAQLERALRKATGTKRK